MTENLDPPPLEPLVGGFYLLEARANRVDVCPVMVRSKKQEWTRDNGLREEYSVFYFDMAQLEDPLGMVHDKGSFKRPLTHDEIQSILRDFTHEFTAILCK